MSAPVSPTGKTIRTRARRLPAVVTFIALIAAGPADRAGFEQSMVAAVEEMHRGMTVAPTGVPDEDFAVMMIAHHQGAISMARAQLTHGSDERLRRLASGMIVEQSQEIAVMKAVLEERRRATAPAAPVHRHRGTGR